jgi:hypothetical protein
MNELEKSRQTEPKEATDDIFGIILCPLNEKRAERAKELENDIKLFYFQLNEYKDRIEDALRIADAAFREAYFEATKQQLDTKAINLATIENENWVFQISEFIAPMFFFDLTYKGLGRAYMSYLLKEGRIGEAAFARIVGLPKWLKFGRVGGSFAVAVGIEALIAAVEEGLKKAELQKAIYELIGARIDVKEKESQVRIAEQSIGSVFASYEVLKKSKITLTKEQVTDILNELIKSHEKSAAAVDHRKELNELDIGRRSWTEEDDGSDKGCR